MSEVWKRHPLTSQFGALVCRTNPASFRLPRKPLHRQPNQSSIIDCHPKQPIITSIACVLFLFLWKTRIHCSREEEKFGILMCVDGDDLAELEPAPDLAAPSMPQRRSIRYRDWHMYPGAVYVGDQNTSTVCGSSADSIMTRSP
ncbi:hypothetical protein PAXRUDRAFT_824547 [Paxillus rubicundulus Ve08.2h10]|uniref:Uncharacterized protein n=1 Tax=Paxillus rubicundulus Ve08.2h10 TaxID=930991 RepID=A0A0D0DHQ7_9AGAM|nr:hypothetical protein PAXRUDRAFT_824547 [Paxillus rubicundulus Ve08.2h10]